MNKQEFSAFAMALRTYYPKENLLPNNQAMELWFRELQDIPYEVAESALRTWVATNKWSPSIAEIREQSSTIAKGDIPDWGDGWEQVIMAVRKFGSYRAREALESMDDITRRCVERIGFTNICMSENPSADRANFRMMYEQLAERKKKDDQIPSNVMQLIEGIRQNNLMIENKGQNS